MIPIEKARPITVKPSHWLADVTRGEVHLLASKWRRQPMELTAEKFSQVVAASAAPRPVEPLQLEHRRRPRAGIRASASIIPLRDSSHPRTWVVEIRDLSAMGIGFLLEQKMSLDEQFALLLPQVNDNPAIVLCAVAFWQPLADGNYAIGAKFVKVLRDTGDAPLPVQITDSADTLSDLLRQRQRRAS